MDSLKAILKAASIHPLSVVELEASEIVIGVTNLFRAIATASPESAAKAAMTLLQLTHNAEEDLKRIEDDDELFRINLVLIEMLKQTSDSVRKVAIARVGLSCDGNCAECTDGPTEDTDDEPEKPAVCYKAGDKEPWS